MKNKNKKSPKISDFLSFILKDRHLSYFLTPFFADFAGFLTPEDCPL